MPSDPSSPGSVRSAAVINEEIRGLWFRAGGVLSTADQRAAYAELVVEWAAAVRVEGAVAEAA
jgi:hypothetical protein